MSRNLSRRKFLQASAASAGAAGFYLTGGVTETRAQNSPNNRLNVAVIGCGGQGGSDLSNVIGPANATRENLVAMCDVDDARASGHYNSFPNVPKFKDYRVMLDRVRNIDAVIVGTPDHVHAFASIAAMRMGKHCYTQKPLTHSVWEARQMKEVAAANRVQTQMGNQGTAGAEFRRGVEAIRAGALGNVTEVHAWTNRPGTFWRQPGVRPKDMPPIPATLDWNLWLGAAPERPYHSSYVPFAWRGWWDFGTGALGDMGCHIMNLPFMALRLTAPTSVEASIDGTLNSECPPNGCTVTFDFPARGTQPACKFYWYEVRRPPERLRNMVNGQISSGGCFIVGDRGTLYSANDYGANWRLLPQDLQASFRAPEPSLPRAEGGHHQEWLRACKGGPAGLSNFIDYASALTETVLLGNVAIRVGQKFTWDSANLRSPDCPATAQYIHREYRNGWSL
jgi:predicted dehydrogenase